MANADIPVIDLTPLRSGGCEGLARNKMRSMLSALGIVIAVLYMWRYR